MALWDVWGSLHLDVEDSVTPVQIPTRKVPIALRQHLEAELKRLANLGVLEPVDVECAASGSIETKSSYDCLRSNAWVISLLPMCLIKADPDKLKAIPKMENPMMWLECSV